MYHRMLNMIALFIIEQINNKMHNFAKSRKEETTTAKLFSCSWVTDIML